ncbi:MAG: fibrobacter succinogenes major paralogous domain-containing protein [candidate division Zixibacteria bacterium]|nr:fibrobacter succinogenes major paralogous domain-containing protein [candidate division Zixibacteria bacterium]
MLNRSKVILFLLVIVSIITTPKITVYAFECGDVDCSGGGLDISDISRLIDFLYLSHEPLCNPLLADVDNSGGGPDISDIMGIISHLYLDHRTLSCRTYSVPLTTTVIPQSDTAVITSYNTSGTVVLDESSTYAQSVSVGDVIIGQDDIDAPNGFLRKVISKSSVGGTIVLETEPATMIEAFEMMSINETNVLRPSDVQSYNLHDGVRYLPNKDDETFSVELEVVLYDQDGNTETTDDQIRLDGTYDFTAALFAEIEISWFTLQKFETGIETEDNTNLTLTANLQWSFDEAAEFDLAEFHLGAIPVGGVVWLVPTLTVEAHIHGDLTVTFVTAISYTQQLRYGFGWENDEYYTISESSKEFTYTEPQLSVEFNFEPGLSLNASCLLYGVAGPYLAAKAGFHFQAALNADPCDLNLTFDLEAILYAVVGIECDILGLDYNWEYQLYTHLIGEWIYPLSGTGIIVINPAPDNINASWTLTGPCDYNNISSGDDTLFNLNPGEYTITWGTVAGWTAPPVEVEYLPAQGVITFYGTYTEVAGPDSTGTVTDIDGNIYQTVKIGNQWWMAENLKVTRYRNKDSIPDVTNTSTWRVIAYGAYCNYGNNESYVETYGRLYNWHAGVDSRNIAPEGWHVPSDIEWKHLEVYLGMSQADADGYGWRGTEEGGKLKDTTLWASPNTGANNESGFTALPGGFRNSDGYFNNNGNYASFWSTTELGSVDCWDLELGYNRSQIYNDSRDRNRGNSIRCIKDSVSVPEITTTAVSEITETTAQCGGEVLSNGGSAVTARGVCWSTDPIPTVADNTTSDGTGTGSYVSSITGLSSGTTYYVRAYASNSVGTGYGTILSFSAESATTGTVTDIDGNIYQTVKIGDQWWMAENLKVTRYRNNDPIPNVTDSATWASLTEGAYCNYDNDEGNVAIYGRLYNGHAVNDSRNLAPEGWHVPTDEEWKQLEMYLGMSQTEADAFGLRGTDEGDKLRETGTTHWLNPNTGATNESGFTALPGGYSDLNCNFFSMGYAASFWSSTELTSNYAWFRALSYDNSQVYRFYDDKRGGFSVRCVRD